MAGARGTRMAGGDDLSPEEKRALYRARLQTDDKERAKRIGKIEFHEGLDSLPDNYDDKAVAHVLRGSWGKDDLERYNTYMQEQSGNNDSPAASEPASDPALTTETEDVTVNPIDDKPITEPTKPGKPALSINQTVNQGNHYGKITTGNITNNSGTISMSNDNNSVNTVAGGDYRPSFMRFMRK